jgi:UDP-N-acetylglucosamine diphosphorylase / glucose-1-phosphate thymidylyltransferase / UDP-N-acetylgalactosamine diphosphorylase / glucosamine-1-phosphate N-acetyltransferase / galactosamine-1-phosphate N-acetyltransferase
MNLVFRRSRNHLMSLLDDNEIPAASIKVLGQPLIIRNLKIASRILDIDTVKIPNEYPGVIRLVQDNFPSINVEGFHEGNDSKETWNNKDKYDSVRTTARNLIIRRGVKNNSIEIPLNSIMTWHSDKKDDSGLSSSNNNRSSGSSPDRSNALITYPIVYPWDFLNAVEKVLQQEVTHITISPNASVAKSSIIKGPCIIEDNVTIDDFCKIKGPTYIGSGSFIGTSCLVRQCAIGSNTKIGFSCEIGRTYFAGNDEIAHLNIILDSVIGKNVWFGGFSGTANVLLTKRAKNITCDIGDGKSVDLGTHHFGSIIGNNCTIGTSVVLLPGRYIPANRLIPDETTFAEKIVVQ